MHELNGEMRGVGKRIVVPVVRLVTRGKQGQVVAQVVVAETITQQPITRPAATVTGA